MLYNSLLCMTEALLKFPSTLQEEISISHQLLPCFDGYYFDPESKVYQKAPCSRLFATNWLCALLQAQNLNRNIHINIVVLILLLLLT